jgi:hypothetical protein
MMIFMSIEPTSAVTLITGIVNGLGALAGLSKKINDVQFNQELIKLQGLIFELQDKLIKMQSENDTLRGEKKALEIKLAVKESTHFEEGVYWTTQSIRDLKESELRQEEVYNIRYNGPFCTICKDQNDKLVHLKFFGVTAAGGTKRVYACNVCKTDYEAPPLNER